MKLVEDDKDGRKDRGKTKPIITIALEEANSLTADDVTVENLALDAGTGADLTDSKDIAVDICPKDEEIFVSCLKSDLFMASER